MHCTVKYARGKFRRNQEIWVSVLLNMSLKIFVAPWHFGNDLLHNNVNDLIFRDL